MITAQEKNITQKKKKKTRNAIDKDSCDPINKQSRAQQTDIIVHIYCYYINFIIFA